jgi:hypothetical protein
MSLATHLLHRCTILVGASTEGPYGTPIITWSEAATNVPCRLVEDQERIVTAREAASLLVTTYTLLVLPNVEVTERERISNVILDDGQIVAGPFSIKAVLRRTGRKLHHKSLQLELVT